MIQDYHVKENDENLITCRIEMPPLLAALATLVVLLAGVVLIWLAKVRPDVGKGRSEIVTDFLRAELLQDGQTATQVFTYDKDILTIGLEFYLPGD